ncbi:hypothetical protein ACFWBN_22320 [Streptomyces sp. NPDC059989]|uniref:hypothetical protein n=1 Tax=Streptomyces sp. NPDC059989 TaxID=3347026 RepID=UPI003687C826
MTTDSAQTATQRAVRTYHEARFRGDVTTAAAQIGEGFSFRSPFITSDSPTGHLDGLDGLLGIVTGVELISELYGDTEATLVYDVHTAPAIGITQHTAEHFRLRDGRITSIALLFDSAPWQAIMSAVGPTPDEAATKPDPEPATTAVKRPGLPERHSIT